MSDATETLPEGISPEDFEWALAHLKKLDQVYQQKRANGEKSMVAAIIDPVYDADVVTPDSTEASGYRLVGRARMIYLLLQQSVDVKILRKDLAGMIEIIQNEPFAFQFQSLSSANPERYKGRQRLSQFRLVLIATW